MNVKVNLIMPGTLYKQSHALVKKGIYANYSELVRQAVRSEVMRYDESEISEEEKKILELIKLGHKNGHFLTKEEMAKHGLRF